MLERELVSRLQISSATEAGRVRYFQHIRGSNRMTVELTQTGTRGFEPRVGRLPRPLMIGLSLAVYRRLGERMRVMGRPLLILTTVGAKTGKTRNTLLGWFPDADDAWLVVASFAGSARHPARYVNMAANPDKVWIEIGKRKLKVEPQSLKGAERAEAWRRIVSLSPGYGAYRRRLIERSRSSG